MGRKPNVITALSEKTKAKSAYENVDDIITLMLNEISDEVLKKTIIEKIQLKLNANSIYKKFKKVVSAEQAYFKEHRSDVKKMFPAFKTAEVTKELKKLWAALPETLKKPYIDNSETQLINFYKTMDDNDIKMVEIVQGLEYVMNPYTGHKIKSSGASGKKVLDMFNKYKGLDTNVKQDYLNNDNPKEINLNTVMEDLSDAED